MSDEKDNVVKFGKSGDAPKIDNLISILENIIGSKEYVFCYFNEHGTPCILPSEEIDPKDIVFLGELMKTLVMSSIGIVEQD